MVDLYNGKCSDTQCHVREQSMSTTSSFEGESGSGPGAQILCSLMLLSVLKCDLTHRGRERERVSREME